MWRMIIWNCCWKRKQWFRSISLFYFFDSPSFSVLFLQVCILKVDLIKATLKLSSRYITERVCKRIRVQICPTSSREMLLCLQSLSLYKEKFESMAIHIKTGINKAADRCFSFDPVLNPSYKNNSSNYHAWLDKVEYLWNFIQYSVNQFETSINTSTSTFCLKCYHEL